MLLNTYTSYVHTLVFIDAFEGKRYKKDAPPEHPFIYILRSTRLSLSGTVDTPSLDLATF